MVMSVRERYLSYNIELFVDDKHGYVRSCRCRRHRLCFLFCFTEISLFDEWNYPMYSCLVFYAFWKKARERERERERWGNERRTDKNFRSGFFSFCWRVNKTIDKNIELARSLWSVKMFSTLLLHKGSIVLHHDVTRFSLCSVFCW